MKLRLMNDHSLNIFLHKKLIRKLINPNLIQPFVYALSWKSNQVIYSISQKRVVLNESKEWKEEEKITVRKVGD